MGARRPVPKQSSRQGCPAWYTAPLTQTPRFAGQGAAQLRKAGIAVEAGFLREECDALNPVFFHYITHKTPYVALKYAMTADGKIATRTGASKWITGDKARGRVQALRHQYRGIVVGVGTVLADDPLLNCRMEGGRNPVRIVCDSHLRIPLDSQLCRHGARDSAHHRCGVR